MLENSGEIKKEKQSIHTIITWAAILGLLILRLFLDGWLRYKIPSITAWIEPVYEIGTYALIVFLIVWERKNLAAHHINPLAILLLIFFPFLAKLILPFYDSTNPLSFPYPLSFSFFLIGGFLLFFVIKNKLNFRPGIKREFLWFAGCAFLGLLVSELESILLIKLLNFPQGTFPGFLALTSPFYQLGYAASMEEPLFRGFLWGALRKLNLPDIWILFIQALIFTAGHLFYLTTDHGLIFVMITFTNALLMGLLVWRTRALSSSMAFHAFYNGSSIFLYWINHLI